MLPIDGDNIGKQWGILCFLSIESQYSGGNKSRLCLANSGSILENVKKYNMQVFNRWGELVFESTDPTNGWNGTYHGQKCQDGTYTWKMQFTWYDRRVYDKVGHVNMLR